MAWFKIAGSIMIVTSLVACGGGESGSSPVSSTSGNGSNAPVSKVTLSGEVTFDHIPHQVNGFGLDYNAMSEMPARGIVVVLLDENDEIIEQTISDGQGSYSFKVGTNKNVKVQARAQLSQSEQWDVRVTDNTFENALFVMEGSLSSSGSRSYQSRNLHAKSGWNGSAYTSMRVAAPFAILDPVYDALKVVETVDSDVVFPEMEYRWSPDNKPIAGNRSLGQIGTSGFHKDENAVYLLGDADRDTDEYDPHVILHEWGHYFEHNLSRLDSMGGLHSLSGKLDPRLAFSEGFGTALAAIITGKPEYKDSLGFGQGGGFGVDVENFTTSRAGWYNEGSIAAILYDVFDDQSDVNDRLNVGFEPIYKAMTDPQIRNGDVFSTIYSFSHALMSQDQISNSDYELVLNNQSVFASDSLGQGERNNGSIATSLPVYKTAEIGGKPITLCSVVDAGRFNKLGNREFVYFNVAAEAQYEISLELISDEGSRDPDFNIWKAGNVVKSLDSSVVNREVFTGVLSNGTYVAEVFDFFNINGSSDRAGDACFEFSIR